MNNSAARFLGISLSVLLASVVGIVPSTAVFAEDSAEANKQTASTTTLTGGVVKVETTLNDLEDARLSISRARKAAANLYDEMTRQQMTMTSTPNMVGSMVIMTPTPSFSGGYLPPRKKWVKASMEEIGPIINLFKEDVDAALESNRRTEVSDNARQQVDSLREQIFAGVKASFVSYKQLEGLTAGSGYDNSTIASTAKELDGQLKTLDRNLKKGIAVLQKDAKSSKKTKAS